MSLRRARDLAAASRNESIDTSRTTRRRNPGGPAFARYEHLLACGRRVSYAYGKRDPQDQRCSRLEVILQTGLSGNSPLPPLLRISLQAGDAENELEQGSEFLTVADIAAMLKLNQQTVRRWIDRGKLRALRVGRRARIRRARFQRDARARIHC